MGFFATVLAANLREGTKGKAMSEAHRIEAGDVQELFLFELRLRQAGQTNLPSRSGSWQCTGLAAFL